MIDAQDAVWTELKLWQDANQDGISQADELKTLDQAGITSLNVASTLKNQSLPNTGNAVARTSTFTRADGTTGQSSDLNLAVDTFNTVFTDNIAVSDAAKALPNMGGSGKVRELQQAATQSTALADLLTRFQAASTRAEQQALLDQVLVAWADTSGMAKNLDDQVAGRYNIEYTAFGSERRSNHINTTLISSGATSPSTGSGIAIERRRNVDDPLIDDTYKSLIRAWSDKLHVLEAFNGQYFFNIGTEKPETPGANIGLRAVSDPGNAAYYSQGSLNPAGFKPLLSIEFAQPQLNLLDQAYTSLRENVYASLVLQTRLKPYLDQVQLVIDEAGIRLDASVLNQTVADTLTANPAKGLGDLLELDKYAGDMLRGTNWDGMATFEQTVEGLPQTEEIATLLNAFNARKLTSGDDRSYFGNDADIVLAGDGNDVVFGNGGDDRLYGGSGDDELYGGEGSDLLVGGAGDDWLVGGNGADTYVFGPGSGNDAIGDFMQNGQRLDTVRFLGLMPEDVSVTATEDDSLTFVIDATGERLYISNSPAWQQESGVGQFVFDDGTVWTRDDALRKTVPAATEGDDFIRGSSLGETIMGLDGNDTLIGQGGNDVLDGGVGDDLLIGSGVLSWTNYEYRPADRNPNQAPRRFNGSDTYLFGRGDGQDTVIDGEWGGWTGGSSDTLKFKDGVLPSDIVVTRTADNLVLTIRDSGDSVTLSGYFGFESDGRNSTYLIENIVFADGTTWHFPDVQTMLFAGSDARDVIIGSSQGEYIRGQSGDDSIYGNLGNDVLEGGDGNDVLMGGLGQDILDGGSGDDVLKGDSSALEYRSSNSFYYYGDYGAPDQRDQGDTYRFGRGDGHDLIIESRGGTGATDRIELKAGVTPGDIRMQRVGNDLVLTLRDTGETLTVQQQFSQPWSAVEEILFTDGTRYDLAEIERRVLIGEDGNDVLVGYNDRDDLIVGNAGNDTLRGNGGNDVLIGGAGNDVLVGGNGSDTYRFGLGDGSDIIQELAGKAGDVDTVELTEGISPDDVIVRRTLQNALSIELKNGADRLLVVDHFDRRLGNAGIEMVRFADGTTWDVATLEAKSMVGTAGNDAIVSSVGDDTLDGLGGNDRFYDIGGYDTYLFGVGSGSDTVTDWKGRVVFTNGIGPNDVKFSMDGYDLVATLTASGDALRITDWMTSDGNRIDAFVFDNGTILDPAQVAELAEAVSSVEILYGSPSDDVLKGTAINSVLHGLDGNDSLYGGDGQDVLDGATGNDQLFGENGDDTLDGGDGNDVLDGGAGRDMLIGGAGENTYVLNRGSGLDMINLGATPDANDTVLFGAGIRPQDISVQLGERVWATKGNWNYSQMVVGIGGNDALFMSGDPATGSIRRFRFEDGTEWTMAQMMAKADGGIIGSQTYGVWDIPSMMGSESDDYVEVTDKSVNLNLAIRLRGNNDVANLSSGHDIVSAGSGDDMVYGRGGDDVIAGEAGNDTLSGGACDDVFVFNRGDGNDIVSVGDAGDTDTLSFGVGIGPADVSATFDSQGRLKLLVDAGTGGTITFEGATSKSVLENLFGIAKRVQFVESDGSIRVFDFAGWVKDNAATLVSMQPGNSLAFDGGAFELTGKVGPAGGLEATAYGQNGDLFAVPNLENNLPSSGDDVIFGTNDTLDGDYIDGGDGNDIILGLDGGDHLNGGLGDDVIYGGLGDDYLNGGGGKDQLFGGYGGDTYHFELGDGEVVIDDCHRFFGSASDGYGGAYNDGGDCFADIAPNVLRFGPGIKREDLRYSELNGDLLIEFSQSSDRVILKGYRSDLATMSRSIDEFYFADGSYVRVGSVEAIGITETGTSGDDLLNGTSNADILFGGEGDDALVGNGGSDRLVGGQGSDTYTIQLSNYGQAASQTTIDESWQSGDVNTIQVSGYTDLDKVGLEFNGRDLLLNLGNGLDSIRFAGFDPNVPGMPLPVSEVTFQNIGATLAFADLLNKGIRIVGTPAADNLNGTSRDDVLIGLSGDDRLEGGLGDDTYLIQANDGTDTIVDVAMRGAGNLVILPEGESKNSITLSYDAQSGYLAIDCSNGSRVQLSGFDPQDPYGPHAVDRFRFGSNGQEISYEELLSLGIKVLGTSDDDILKGTALSDWVIGADGYDMIFATPGEDVLDGGAGDDLYVVNLGDGIVEIRDNALPFEGNVLRFGDGISPDRLHNNLRFESTGFDNNGSETFDLLLPYGNEGDVVRLTGFNPYDVENGGHAVDQFEFADGTVVDYATLVSWTFVNEGDSSDNGLTGTSVADRLYGYAGDDLLEAGAGNDILTGGVGNDELDGGIGRDAYVFNLGDGQDVIYDTIEAGADGPVGNIVSFGAGITRDDIRVESDGFDLLIHYGNQGDVIRVVESEPFSANAIDTLEFADGSTVTLNELMNQAPMVNGSIADQSLLEDAPFQLQLPADLFIDPEGGDFLENISVSGYTQAPTWLKYDPQTRTLYGTPENADVGTFAVTVSAVDGLGASASYTFNVSVANTNDAPEIAAEIGASTATQGKAFSYEVPANAFRDVDVGDTLTLSAQLENGDSLPAWLAFDSATGTLSGTPANGDVGQFRVRIVATDLAGTSASQVFSLAVENVNDAPVVLSPIADVTTLEDQAFTYSLPPNVFADIDYGDTLTLSASMADGSALPSWLSFDAATGNFSGTPTNDDVGTLSLRITATDLAGANISTGFNIAVANVNDAPEVVGAVPDHAAVQGDAFTYALPTDAFRDVDVGDVLTLSAQLESGDPLPAWLSFDSTTGTLSGTPANGDVGQLRVRIVATDLAGTSANQVFSLAVENVNDAPVVLSPIADVTTLEDQVFTYSLPSNVFADIDYGDTLTLSASMTDGSELPSWLSFDAATGSFSGTPTNDDVGTLSLRITATDLAGANIATGFNIAVANVNDAPEVVGALGDHAAVQGEAFTYTLPTNAFRDVDIGDQLTLSAQLENGDPLPSWLSFDAATGVLSGVPANADVGQLRVRVVATDLSGASANQVFNLSVLNVNDAPTVTIALSDLALQQDQAFSYSLPSNAFSDIDVGDVLTLSARLSDGSPLPTWLTFDAATGTFSGKPTNSDIGALSIQISATDLAGASASTNLNVAVNNVNDAPMAGTLVADQAATEDSAFTFTLPAGAFSDVDVGDSLSYGITLADGSALPAWLSFDAATATLQGTPTNGDVGSLNLSVTATDKAGATATQSFALSVTNVNDAPVVGTALSDQNGKVGSSLSFALPNTAFTDVDAGDSLSYSANQADGQVLPSWLSFDATTQQFVGTPTTQGNWLITVTAKDLAGASASQTFSVAVAGGNAAPVVVDDTASASEDGTLLLSGNVLSNDTDADPDTTLSLANAGTYKGTYGVLSLLANGSYGYALDNKSQAVQALGAGVTAYDRFDYQASDGQDSTLGHLTIAVSGKNDTPTLVKPLDDYRVGKGSAFQLSVSSRFSDVDQGDHLTYKATLSNGKALPTWLKFDGATGTFSGQTPAKEKGALEITVTASDGHGALSSVSNSFKLAYGQSGGDDGSSSGCGASEPNHGGCHQGDDHSPKDRKDDDRDHKNDHRQDERDDHGPSSKELAAIANLLAHFDAVANEHGRQCDEDELNASKELRGSGHWSQWQSMASRLDLHLSGSDGRHLGDDGESRYGQRNDPFSGCLIEARNVLAGSGRVMAAQQFQSFQGLQEGLAKLG